MKKILIVEDDEFLVDAYKVKLKKENFSIQIAMDGQEALETIKTSPPQLIILDVIMPKKDGFEVLKDLKGNDATKSIPVLVASNVGEETSIQKALDMGAESYFIKSDISIQDLVNMIKKYAS